MSDQKKFDDAYEKELIRLKKSAEEKELKRRERDSIRKVQQKRRADELRLKRLNKQAAWKARVDFEGKTEYFALRICCVVLLVLAAVSIYLRLDLGSRPQIPMEEISRTQIRIYKENQAVWDRNRISFWGTFTFISQLMMLCSAFVATRLTPKLVLNLRAFFAVLAAHFLFVFFVVPDEATFLDRPWKDIFAKAYGSGVGVGIAYYLVYLTRIFIIKTKKINRDRSESN